MSDKTKICIAKGDGIGPEIMDATMRILDAAGARIDAEEIEVGEKVYLSGELSGIPAEAWDKIMKHKIILKGPITTPFGGGYKSLNVTIRKTLGLFSNVRPCVAFHPYVQTKHPEMNVVIVRENEEDLYAGIEHQQTDEVVQCLKLISRPGCEKIIRYAFEYAVANGRKKVTAFVKDNIMKLTDGLFHKVFDEIRAEYPSIESDSYIVDIGTARLATRPEIFDVIVVENLYGDIISDIAAEMTGSVGLGGSANVGLKYSMFEAIHGSAPDIAGKNVANPSGIILGAVMMLNHIGQQDVAEKIHNAWLKTLEDGLHTGDIYREGTSVEKLSTSAFADAVIARLGQMPEKLSAVDYTSQGAKAIDIEPMLRPTIPSVKTLVGVDMFVHFVGDADSLADQLKLAETDTLKLFMISNRGAKVWPNGNPETFCTDHWRCRFKAAREGAELSNSAVLELFTKAYEKGIDFIKSEHLYHFDGVPGFTRAQGE
jgi:isocitrate dehydrogenase